MPYARSSDGFKLYYEELDPMKVIHRKIRGSKLVVLSPASHFANRDQPEAWNRAALRFLARVDGARKSA
jgi:pimeloyl-ACP methyl ester carboxylesterase